MSDTFARVKSILSSIVFWMVLASTVISQVLDEFVASEFDDDTLASVIEWGGSALAILALAIAAIRRVTAVLPEQVGLTLPPEADGTGFVMHRTVDGDTTKTPVAT